jgi:hypothetical protein
MDKNGIVCFGEETVGTNATRLKKRVLGSSSGKDGFSVYWKLIAVDACLKTNELKNIKQQLLFQNCSFWGRYNPPPPPQIMWWDKTSGWAYKKEYNISPNFKRICKRRNCIYSKNTTNIIPSDYLFEFKRFQFSVKLRFSVIITKARSQPLKEVDIYLREECFSTYVACTIVGSAKAYTYWRQNEKQQL